MKTKRSIWVFFLLALSVLFCVEKTTTVKAAETCGDYGYTVLSDGTAQIVSYSGAGGDITIPSTLDGYKVTVISYQTRTNIGVFYGNTAITSVTIPDTVTSIEGAFQYCTNLKSVSLGENLTDISSAFQGCTSLTELTIPESVTGMAYVCGSCTSLQKVVIEDGCIAKIGVTAFANCTSLTDVVIGYEAFYYCTSLKSVSLPASLTSIGEGAFAYCTKLASFSSSSKKLKSIGSKAFYGDSKLTAVTLSTSKLTKSNVKSKAFTGINSKCAFKVPSAKVSSYKKVFTARGAKSTITVKKK